MPSPIQLDQLVAIHQAQRRELIQRHPGQLNGLHVGGQQQIVAGGFDAEEARATVELDESPGQYGRILAELGETDQTMLERAAAVDRAGEQLMIESARVTDVRRGFISDASAAGTSLRPKAVAAPLATREYEAEI